MAHATALLVALVAIVFGLAVFSGLFHQIEIHKGKPPVSKLHVAYKFGRGSYGGSAAGELFTEVSKAAPDLRCFSVYYDDPNMVPSESLRYIVGVVLSEGDKEPNKDLESQLTSKRFKTADFPEMAEAVHTTFPFKTTLSMYIAIYRIYSALDEYVKTRDLRAHPYMEMYTNDVIHFIAPLSKQMDFYVPETGGTSGFFVKP